MAKNYWRRFNFYEGVIVVFLMINILFVIINQRIEKPIIPIEIAGYFFWLSLGLYLGFKLCIQEYKRMWKEANKSTKEDLKKI
jgi:hypothetical protein